MLAIGDLLISEDILSEKFACNVQACRGACCWEGDWGAPLERQEIVVLQQIREHLRPFLKDEGNAVIDSEGVAVHYPKPDQDGTPLVNNRDCVYLAPTQDGIAKCGIEQAFEAGIIEFKKPISCHLYPIRYEEDDNLGFRALNYDRWDICAPACTNGENLGIRLYEFAKEALIRKFGDAFFTELDAIANDLNSR